MRSAPGCLREETYGHGKLETGTQNCRRELQSVAVVRGRGTVWKWHSQSEAPTRACPARGASAPSRIAARGTRALPAARSPRDAHDASVFRRLGASGPITRLYGAEIPLSLFLYRGRTRKERARAPVSVAVRGSKRPRIGRGRKNCVFCSEFRADLLPPYGV